MRIPRRIDRRVGFVLGTPLLAIGVILVLTTPGVIGDIVPVSKDGTVFGLAGMPTQQAFNHAIKHIIVLMMENHAFDNYFGTYCQKKGPYCSMKVNGIPPGTCVPKYPNNPSRGCVVPFPLGIHNLSIHQPLPHDYNSSIESYNNGSMNGFYQAEGSGIYPFGYYNAKTAPLMWDFAEEYAMGDDFFGSDLSSSLPNHWYLVAGQTPLEVQYHTFKTSIGAYTANRSLYLNEANNTTAIEDLLANTSISWGWYDHPIANNYSNAIGSLNPNGPRGTALLLWNPLAAKAESYNNPKLHSHFDSNTQFFSAAAAGTLPQISFLIPPGARSDHPPWSTAAAQGYIASVIDAVEDGPEWNSTALFITYDEYGGFYDNVAPPKALGTNLTLGFRLPFIVVSPYAKENYVSHSLGYPDAILRLIEDRFGLPCLTAMDCNAPSLLQYFDFNQAPRPPIPFPTTIWNATYPMPLQNATNFNSWPSAPFVPPTDLTTFPDGEGLDVD